MILISVAVGLFTSFIKNVNSSVPNSSIDWDKKINIYLFFSIPKTSLFFQSVVVWRLDVEMRRL